MNEEPLNPNGIAGKPLYPTADANGNVLKTFEAATAPQESLPKPTIQESITTLHKENTLQNLRTYQSDVAEAVRQQGATVVKIAVAEKQKEATQPVHTDPKRNIALLVLSIILMIGSGMAVTVYTIIHVFLKAEQIIPIKEEVLFATERTQVIALENNQQIPEALIRQGIDVTGKANTITRLKFTTSTTTIGEVVEPPQALTGDTFASLVSPRLPDGLIRSLDPLYSTGVYHTNTNEKIPYIVLKTKNYETAFSSVFQWESSMLDDLQPYFSQFSSTSTLAVGSPFTDVRIRNIDVRLMRDAAGTSLLMYAFPDRNTLIITTNEDALREIFSRLSTSQLVQ